MTRWLRAATVCGILPIVVGVGIFLAWVIWPLKTLMEAGILWLLAGPAIILAGIILAAVHTVLSARRRAVSRRVSRWRWLGLLGLYLANFLIAGAVMKAAWRVDRLANRYTITVVNNTPTVLEDVRLAAPGIELDYRNIPPGGKVTEEFLIPYEGGRMTLTCRYADVQVEETFKGYYTPAIAFRGTITVASNGDVELSYSD